MYNISKCFKTFSKTANDKWNIWYEIINWTLYLSELKNDCKIITYIFFVKCFQRREKYGKDENEMKADAKDVLHRQKWIYFQELLHPVFSLFSVFGIFFLYLHK